MASTRTLTALSSSFISYPRWRYRVFLSFNGEDTRESFINHLLASLEDKWSAVSGDDYKLEHGKYNCEELLKALRESICAIVVISKAYAFSKRCLIELTEILECWFEDDLEVFPIFYHVNPSDLQKRKGDFERAFTEHRKSPEVDGKQMETWRAALCEVCGLAGRRVLDDRYLAGIIEDIKENILRAFGVEVSNSSQVFVGIQRRVSEIMALLTMRSDDAQIIGIYGSAGIGKTTLVKVICDKLASHFNGGCFLVNFREKNKKQDIVELRRLILRVTGSRVASPQVLLMLDDVNSREQLKELAESRSWFGGSSRILVTSRDRHLFHCYADKTYEIESLTDTEALQLFSWNVFSKFHPDEGFLELSQEVVDYAGGLPLTLNIIGSSLKDGTRAQWRSYIDGIRKANSDRGAQCLSNTQGMVDRKFWNVFKLSFERLEKLEKEVFLHIACFFHGLDIDYIISKLDSLYDHPCFPIEVLRSKSWVKITKNRKVHIHDLLRRMGLQIVHDESPEELGGCSRLWSYKDIIHVIKNKSVS